MKKVILNSVLSIFFIFAYNTLLEAQSAKFILRVDGLACPFCAYGLEKKIMKIDGVRSYDVNMKKGEVLIEVDDAAGIDIGVLKKAVKEAGFTLRGIVLKRDGITEGIDLSAEK